MAYIDFPESLEGQKKRKAFLKAKEKVKLNRHKKVPDERLVY